MNYYQYKKRAPKRGGSDYIKPFIVIIIFVAIIIAGWRLMGSILVDDTSTQSSEKVLLEIETGSAKAMTSTGSEWKNIPSNIYLYEGEKVRTQSDGRMTLTFFDQNIARLDKRSEVKIETLQLEGSKSTVGLRLDEGQVWIDVKNELSSASYSVSMDNLLVEATNAIFAVSAPGTVYVLSGSVTAKVVDNGTVADQAEVGVGQQVTVDALIAKEITAGAEKDLIFAIDDSFKGSNWYRWNQTQSGTDILPDDVSDTEEAEEDNADGDTAEDTDEAQNEDTAEDDAKDSKVKDPNDKEAPDIPTITDPGSNDESVEIDDVVMNIEGTVSADTAVVIVNDYRLARYIPGSEEFRYTANVGFENLEVGDNEYRVIAEDENGNKSEAAIITLVLTQEVYDEKITEEEKEVVTEDEGAPTASATGGVSITSPNNGDNLVTSETSFEIKGEVPDTTAKVLVNDYQLQGFTAGDTAYKYNANSTLDTLKIGELNTYTVKAYDAEGELIGTAIMTIDVESGSNGSGDPTFTMPISTGTYNTTLNQLVIGGAIGKWVEMVYLNGSKLNEYIPGSEEWKTTVTLVPGENIFNVYGEKDGKDTATASITIDYQN